MKANILTLFPNMLPGTLGQSLAGQALDKGLWEMNITNIRDFGEGVHKTVDDTPFGGGAGMVLRPDILSKAIESVPERGRMIYLSHVENFSPKSWRKSFRANLPSPCSVGAMRAWMNVSLRLMILKR